MMQQRFSISVLLFENITANFRAEFPNPSQSWAIFLVLIIIFFGGIHDGQAGHKPVSPKFGQHSCGITSASGNVGMVVPAQPMF